MYTSSSVLRDNRTSHFFSVWNLYLLHMLVFRRLWVDFVTVTWTLSEPEGCLLGAVSYLRLRRVLGSIPNIKASRVCATVPGLRVSHQRQICLSILFQVYISNLRYRNQSCRRIYVGLSELQGQGRGPVRKLPPLNPNPEGDLGSLSALRMKCTLHLCLSLKKIHRHLPRRLLILPALTPFNAHVRTDVRFACVCYTPSDYCHWILRRWDGELWTVVIPWEIFRLGARSKVICVTHKHLLSLSAYYVYAILGGPVVLTFYNAEW